MSRASVMVEETGHDLRYAVRTPRKSPAFAATGVVVLALAIGVDTAMFSVLNAVLFRPLPYPSPEQEPAGRQDRIPDCRAVAAPKAGVSCTWHGSMAPRRP
jgi:hypothetical protein